MLTTSTTENTPQQPSAEIAETPKLPQDDPTYPEAFSFPCDICYHLKISRNKQVKWVHWNEEDEDHSIILCSPCQTNFNSPEASEEEEPENKANEAIETNPEAEDKAPEEETVSTDNRGTQNLTGQLHPDYEAPPPILVHRVRREVKEGPCA